MTLKYRDDEGENSTSSNGFLSATEIKDNTTSWLNYYKDNDDFFEVSPEEIYAGAGNWIRSGCGGYELNESNPYLTFNTSDIQTVVGDESVAQSAMDLIKIVPNPYYGSSKYERDQVDHRVKITNLPKTCTISIYNVSGTLVRQVSLDSEENVTGWDWDLKNNYNVAIPSGVYIIHVDAGDIGQKVLKWFGALRPIDLDSF